MPPLNRAWEPPDFSAASEGLSIEGIVFVECGREAAQNLAEAAWVTELARADSRILGIVAHAAVEIGAAVRPDLAVLARNPLVKGVRRLLQDETESGFCLRPAFVEGVRALAEFGLSFDLCLYHPQMPDAIELVRRCPDVTFVLDHVGKPAIREGRLDPWRGHMRELAALPNVWCKISGMTTEADIGRWRSEDLRPYIDHSLECFGFTRSVYGGDWPVATLATPYSRWLGEVQAAVRGVPEEDQRDLFMRNAARCYRLGSDPGRLEQEEKS